MVTLQSSLKHGPSKFSNPISSKSLSFGLAYLSPSTKPFSQSATISKSNTLGNTSVFQQSNVKATGTTSGSTSAGSTASNQPYKCFTTAELKLRREKGLCYYCDDKYHPGHKCQAACFLLVGQEEIEELLNDEISEENPAVLEEGNNVNLMEVVPEISLNALAGQFHPSTLRVIGSCAGKTVKVSIDNGSNNNFINPQVAGRLKLKQTSIPAFKVGTGSGEFLSCNNKCEKVNLNIQNHVFITDLFVLEIKGANVVLECNG